MFLLALRTLLIFCTSTPPLPLPLLLHSLAHTAHAKKDCKGWVGSGRPAGDGAQVVLEAMGTLDAIVRRSAAPDAHNKAPYLERLSAVYGQPPVAVKVSEPLAPF